MKQFYDEKSDVMEITKDMVSYVAELSRLKLNDEQAETTRKGLGEIIGYMDILKMCIRDSCGKCLETGKDYREIKIDSVITSERCV